MDGTFRIHLNGPGPSSSFTSTLWDMVDTPPYVTAKANTGIVEYKVCDDTGDTATSTVFYLDDSPTPVSYAGLPAGFRCTLAAIGVGVYAHAANEARPAGSFTVSYAPFDLAETVTDGILYNIVGGTYAGYWKPEGPIYSPGGLTNLAFQSLANSTVTVNWTAGYSYLVGPDTFYGGIGVIASADIVGTYTTNSWTYSAPHYTYGVTATPVAPPSLSLTSISPTSGDIAGGTSVTLTGTGFGDGATVTIGGLAATSVVVVNELQITCATPAHARGAVAVTVTNLDGVSSTLFSAYTYTGTVPIWYKPDWPHVTIPPVVVSPLNPILPPVDDVCDVVVTGYFHAGVVGTEYDRADLDASGGTAPYTFDIFSGDATPIPPGLSLDSSGTLNGTPEVGSEGVYTFILRCRDSNDCAAYVAYTIIIWAAAEDFDPPTFPWTRLSPNPPPDFVFDIPFSPIPGGPVFPPGTFVPWVPTATPDTRGWWLSVDEGFAGAGTVLNNSSPKAPRGYSECSAVGSTGRIPGTMGCGVAAVWRNKLVYAARGYTITDDANNHTEASIRMFDGTSDREIVTIPLTVPSTTVQHRGVMTVLAANDTIYLCTQDTGLDNALETGRVFNLDPISGTLTQLGAVFPTGHLPWALAWHLGRLWCGTYRGNEASGGKVYYFRPGIDTAWTEDFDLATIPLHGVTSLYSFKGLLYVGTTGWQLAGSPFTNSPGRILVRDGLGAYTTSVTGPGTANTSGLSFVSMIEFGGNLYATLAGSGTTVGKVYKFDGTTWTVPYTNPGVNVVPFNLMVDGSTLYAFGGGSITDDAMLIKSTNGTSWTDLSAFLSNTTRHSVALQAWGVIKVV